MKPGKLALLFALGAAVTLFAASCTASYTDYYFAGRVYNGVDGTRLVNYTIELQYLDRRVEGTVDEDGRYFIGPLTPFNDYTIAISADGYRSFLSHNIMKVDDELSRNNAIGDDNDHPDVSQYFDAYVYPTSAQSPAATFHITESDSDMPPAGTIRMKPTATSSLVTSEQSAGVANQIWFNDEDIQFSTVTRAFSNGEADFAAGDLVYGVTYAVTVFGIAGHAESVTSYTAGTDGDPTIAVEPLTQTPLAISFVSTQLGTPIATGDAVFLFNEPVVLDPTGTPDSYVQALESSFQIDSPDANMNGQLNALKAYDPAAPAGSRGLAITVAGDKLTLSWDRAVALMSTDTADPIKSVTYGDLSGVRVRPVGGDLNSGTTLGALFGADSITVQVSP